MEKEFIETLVNDISKAKTTDDKLHLITVFLSELAAVQNKHSSHIASVSEILPELKENIMIVKDAIISLTEKVNYLSGLNVKSLENAGSQQEQIASTFKHILNFEGRIQDLNTKITAIHRILHAQS